MSVPPLGHSLALHARLPKALALGEARRHARPALLAPPPAARQPSAGTTCCTDSVHRVRHGMEAISAQRRGEGLLFFVFLRTRSRRTGLRRAHALAAEARLCEDQILARGQGRHT